MGFERYAWLVVLVSLAVAVASFSIYFYLEKHSGDIGYPSQLPGGYKPVSVIRGEEAVAATRGLHWNPSDIPVTRAVIVTYADGTRLWASRVSGDACSVLARMVSAMRMHEAELPYTAPIEHSVDGVTVYFSMDKRTGGLHALWCSHGLVIWVQLGASGLRGLETIIEYYKSR